MASNVVIGGAGLTADPVKERYLLEQDRNKNLLAMALQQENIQNQARNAQISNDLERERLRSDVNLQNRVLDIQANKPTPFNLKEALFREYEKGRGTPEVLEGLNMRVETTPAESPLAYQDIATDLGLTASGLKDGKIEYTAPTKTEVESSGLTKDQLKNATTLRKEFFGSPIVKQAESVKSSALKMEQAFNLATSGDEKSRIASDQALGVLFQKLLDPTSVVRESEYARTPEGASVINQALAYIPKLQKGGLALTNDDRQAIYTMAKSLQEVAELQMKDKIGGYSQIARQYNVPNQLVFGEYTNFAEELPAPQGNVVIQDQTASVADFGSESQALSAGLPVGTVFTINGRRAVME